MAEAIRISKEVGVIYHKNLPLRIESHHAMIGYHWLW